MCAMSRDEYRSNTQAMEGAEGPGEITVREYSQRYYFLQACRELSSMAIYNLLSVMARAGAECVADGVDV